MNKPSPVALNFNSRNFYLALPKQESSKVNGTISDKSKALVRSRLTKPLLERAEHFRESRCRVHGMLLDAGKLGAERRQARVVDGTHVRVKLINDPHRLAVDEDSRELDNLSPAEDRDRINLDRFQL